MNEKKLVFDEAYNEFFVTDRTTRGFHMPVTPSAGDVVAVASYDSKHLQAIKNYLPAGLKLDDGRFDFLAPTYDGSGEVSNFREIVAA